MKKTNQKPIECDAHLKYLCQKCGQSHWLSLKESSTKNFKIVCYCGYVFSVKRISRIKIVYIASSSKPKKENKPSSDKQSISDSLLSQGIKNLISYGFTTKEAEELLIKAYSLNPTQDIASLVKVTLSLLRN